jgi:hypothetical protein
MKRCLCTLLVSSLVLTVNSIARDVVLPAGTILRCTLNEPNFSTNTASVGDPVLCHLRGLMEFGQEAFPRGSYLVGHLDAAKDPGHFVGKGYLELHFDRIGVASGDMPLNAKIIAAGKYKVDREGKIHGKGHAKRDAAEWMLPPLWPWKVVMLPARGPRPKLKGETVLTLRLMDDVEIPQVAQTFGPSGHFFSQPSSGYYNIIPGTDVQPGDSVNLPAQDSTAARQHTAIATKALPSLSAPIAPKTAPSVLILRSGTSYLTTAIRVDGDRISYTLSDGTSGEVNLNDVDWTKTIQTNAENGAMLALTGSLR